jgi:uncharacterized membrane protein
MNISNTGAWCRKKVYKNRLCKSHYEKVQVAETRRREGQDLKEIKTKRETFVNTNVHAVDDPFRKVRFHKNKEENTHTDESGMTSLKKKVEQ